MSSTTSVFGGVEALVDAFATGVGQPGLAYGVIRDGELVHAGGRGWCAFPGSPAASAGRVPDADTVFRIASMTKSFTAAAILLLRDEGVLALDEEVLHHVPALSAVRLPTADSAPLTIRTLLTMAGGLPTDDPWGDRQQSMSEADFDALLAGGLSFAWAPGTAFEYSNLGYALLGRVVAAAAGVSYREAVTRRLLEPLSMRSTCFDAAEVPPERLAVGHARSTSGWDEVPFASHGAFAPMGGIFSSVRDLARWVGEFTDAFPPRDDPEVGHPLRRASRREQQQPHRAYLAQLAWSAIDRPPALRTAAYGFGLVVEDHPRYGTIVGHSGGYPGFGSHMRWHTGRGLGTVVLANGTYSLAFTLAERILDALLAEDTPRRRVSGVPVTGPAPGSGSPWAATRAAAAEVERLLVAWDDDAAAGLFAANVDLDEPLSVRRARIEHVRTVLGPLSPDPTDPVEHASPAHQAWWLRGPRGRLRVEIRLSPERPPRVQSLTLVPIPHPSADLRRALSMLIWSMNSANAAAAPPLDFTEDVDRAALQRLLQAGAAWAGRVAEGDVVAGDGWSEAAVLLRGARRDLVLGVALAISRPPGPDGAPRVAAVTLRPSPDA
ncbi:MAG TPA: serine hydrolase domain-containing protein [Kineosporiaceae bacterium]|nr:serine hydrolase domain-containing protein [Kineosporiaceae bacterium]